MILRLTPALGFLYVTREIAILRFQERPECLPQKMRDEIRQRLRRDQMKRSVEQFLIE